MITIYLIRDAWVIYISIHRYLSNEDDLAVGIPFHPSASPVVGPRVHLDGPKGRFPGGDLQQHGMAVGGGSGMGPMWAEASGPG